MKFPENTDAVSKLKVFAPVFNPHVVEQALGAKGMRASDFGTLAKSSLNFRPTSNPFFPSSDYLLTEETSCDSHKKPVKAQKNNEKKGYCKQIRENGFCRFGESCWNYLDHDADNGVSLKKQ